MEHGYRDPEEKSIKDEIPTHVMSMEERHRVGGQPEMARGAFFFSLQALCNMLIKTTSMRCVSWRNVQRSDVVVPVFQDFSITLCICLIGFALFCPGLPRLDTHAL